jgi:hypothetical protein
MKVTTPLQIFTIFTNITTPHGPGLGPSIQTTHRTLGLLWTMLGEDGHSHALPRGKTRKPRLRGLHERLLETPWNCRCGEHHLPIRHITRTFLEQPQPWKDLEASPPTLIQMTTGDSLELLTRR